MNKKLIRKRKKILILFQNSIWRKSSKRIVMTTFFKEVLWSRKLEERKDYTNIDLIIWMDLKEGPTSHTLTKQSRRQLNYLRSMAFQEPQKWWMSQERISRDGLSLDLKERREVAGKFKMKRWKKFSTSIYSKPRMN